MKSTVMVILVSLYASLSYGSWFEKKVNGKLLYDHFKEAGVPLPALERTFELLDINDNKEFKVKLYVDYKSIKISNKNYVVIIDYSQPSSTKRLYFLNLISGKAEKYYVAHGVNTGDDIARSFSNEMNSKKTSLGFYITGSTYIGSHGESLFLHGIEKSNSRAFERAIVLHGADYVSMEFLNKYRRMGRSWGCPAVSKAISKKLLPFIKNGAVLYAYHKDLMPVTQTSPSVQEVSSDQTNTSGNGNEIVPEEINP